MGLMDSIFGKANPQAGMNPPTNPNLAARNPNDPTLSAQQRNDVLQSQAAAKAATTNNPGNAVVASSPPGTVGVTGDPQQPQKANSPLDDFSKIWETQANPNQSAAKEFKYPKMDPAKLRAGVQKMDFASGVPDELLSKAVGGDLAAFRQTLNHVGQSAFETGFQATDKYNSQLFNQFDQSISGRIPAEVKGIQSQAKLMSELKSMDHPAVAPILTVLNKQMQQMYPDASPDEVAAYSKKYMVTMAQAITGQLDTDKTTQASQQQRNQGGNSSRTVSDFSDFENHQ